MMSVGEQIWEIWQEGICNVKAIVVILSSLGMNTPYQCIYQCPLLSHPRNSPHQRTLSPHPLTHPLTPPSHTSSQPTLSPGGLSEGSNWPATSPPAPSFGSLGVCSLCLQSSQVSRTLCVVYQHLFDELMIIHMGNWWYTTWDIYMMLYLMITITHDSIEHG